MVYKALDIARYIVNYSNKQEYGISNLKLQKILYFVQAEFLALQKKQPCFQEEIEAWGFGPVVPGVYKEFRQYGGSNIPTIQKYIEIDEDWSIIEKKYDSECIKQEDKNIINKIIDGFADYSASSLVSITHKQDPWMKTYKKGQCKIIPKQIIKEFFEE